MKFKLVWYVTVYHGFRTTERYLWCEIRDERGFVHWHGQDNLTGAAMHSDRSLAVLATSILLHAGITLSRVPFTVAACIDKERIRWQL